MCIAECVNHFWTHTSKYNESKKYDEITWTAIDMSDDEAFRILRALVLDKARQCLDPQEQRGQAYPGEAQQGHYRQAFEELCRFISLVIATLEAHGDPAVEMPQTGNGRDERVRMLLDELEQLIQKLK